MRSYGQYCPVAKGAEVLGDRWTLLIARELLFGPLRFTDIERGLPGISRSTLTQRLHQMQRDGIVETAGGSGYQFTAAGVELKPVIQAIGDWVARWILTDPSPAELDPELLVLWISRHVRADRLPARRTVVEFRFRGEVARGIWLVMEPKDVSVCLSHPGFDVDVVVHSSPRDLYRVYMGRTTLPAEENAGRITLDGMPRMTRSFPDWMAWSNFAQAAARAQTAGSHGA